MLNTHGSFCVVDRSALTCGRARGSRLAALFKDGSTARDINRACLGWLQGGTERVFRAADQGSTSMLAGCPASHEDLVLKVGAVVALLVDLDPGKGLVKDVRGKVTVLRRPPPAPKTLRTSMLP